MLAQSPTPAAPLFGRSTAYANFVREERQLCAVLAHLLLSRGDNVKKFVGLVNTQLQRADAPEYIDPTRIDPDALELYLEFAFLRDHWTRFDLDAAVPEANRRKRDFLVDLFSRVPELDRLTSALLPTTVAEFNTWFMGAIGGRWQTYIGSPSNWRVPALHALAAQLEPDHEERQRALFLALCRFKWAFNG